MTVRPCARCGAATECRKRQKFCGPCAPLAAAETLERCNREYRSKLSVTERNCSKCGASMPVGRTHRWCTTCMSAYNAAAYEAAPQMHRERAREYAHQHPEARRAYKARPDQQQKARERGVRLYHADIEKSRAKSRANQGKRSAAEKRGSATAKDYLDVLESARGVCAMCFQCPRQKLHVDHIVPLSRGGEHSRENLQALCQPCNQWKYNRLITELP